MNAPMPVPEHRRAALAEVAERVTGARRVVLTTHLNADGDGAGSQAAVGGWLVGRGIAVTIVNPTPFPDTFRFLLPQGVTVADRDTDAGAAALAQGDVLLVLDTSEPRRIHPIGDAVPRSRTIVVDHHPPGDDSVADVGLLDPTAAATGELVYDLIAQSGDAIPDASLLGIYVALVTDTGSFRYSNTNPRTHEIAADLLRRGIDPESVFQRLYATVPRRRVELLRRALATLEQEQESGISWLVVRRAEIDELGATPEDLDGLVEHARSLQGTEVALLFRETAEGGTKVSFRSNGRIDVNRIARRFEGGGHVKASGATLEASPQEAVGRVLDAVRDAVGEEAGNA